MKLGITGAFGFLGANVAAAALAQGREVVAFSSKSSSHPLFDPSDAELRPLDILDPASTRRAFRGLDAVIHLAGLTGFSRAMKRRLWDANVLGSRNVYEAILATGVAKLVDVSSVNALGPGDGSPVTEDNADPYRPGNVVSFRGAGEALSAVEASLAGDYRFLSRSRVTYFDAKTAAYELHKRYVAARSLPALALFPGTAVGPGDVHGGISLLVDGVWEGRLAVTAGGSTSFMDAGDFARGVLRALDGGRVGQGYIMAGASERGMDYAAFMRLAATVAGRTPPRGWPVRAPSGAAAVLAAAAERLAPRAGLTLALALSGALRQSFSSAKAMAELGYAPVTALEDSIRACRAFSEARGKNH